MDLRKLKTLIDLVAESGIAELEITEGEGKVRIVKSAAPGASGAMMQMPPQGYAPQYAPQYSPQYASPPSGSAQPAASGLAPAEPPADAPPAGHIVKSPMVGTFYRSAQPGSAPFVDIGSEVKQGETVCIIEAMKLLNEIECDFAGRIKAILVENGQPVEYGQPLFVVEPA
jgi:acetyl-CoA carboxylase biotin carboxyl carrier protein